MQYYDIYVTFSKDSVSDGFVETIYDAIFRSGFQFKSGSNYHENMSLEDIIRVNQQKLMSGFELGIRQDSRHDYIQILLEPNLYRQVRVYWSNIENVIKLKILFPEDEILLENKDYKPIEVGDMTITNLTEYYKDFKVRKDRISPIILVARNLWDTGLPGTIESDKGLYYGDEGMIRTDESGLLCIRPFCILKKQVYEKYRELLDPGFIIEKISNDGILVVDESKIEKTDSGQSIEISMDS